MHEVTGSIPVFSTNCFYRFRLISAITEPRSELSTVLDVSMHEVTGSIPVFSTNCFYRFRLISAITEPRSELSVLDGNLGGLSNCICFARHGGSIVERKKIPNASSRPSPCTG
jgi:hypothetical protein